MKIEEDEMKRKSFFFIMIFIWSFSLALPHAWINEIHYDNSGTDVNEFVEVVVESPEDHYMGDLVLYMYNGYDGRIYCLDSIDEFETGDRLGDFQFYTWYQRGIQNDTEGMLLVFKDTLVDIIAYEGSFTGVSTPGTGLIFPDLMCCETGYGPDTCSIYLTGMPGSVWEYGTATPGCINIGQSLSEDCCPVLLNYFQDRVLGDKVELCWQTASETENLGFRLCRNGREIAFIRGAGTVSGLSNYKYIDQLPCGQEEFTYTLFEKGYDMREKHLASLTVQYAGQMMKLGHPSSPSGDPLIELPIQLSCPGKLRSTLYDIRGRKIRDIVYSDFDTGRHRVKIDTQTLAGGQYILTCNFKEERKHIKLCVMK